MTHPSYFLGISDSHDSGATLVDEQGNIVAAVNEERFSRRKHHSGIPYESIKYLFERTNVDPKDVKTVSLVGYDFLLTTGSQKDHSKWIDVMSKETGFMALIVNILYYPVLLLSRSGCLVALGKLLRPGRKNLRRFLAEQGVRAPLKSIEHHTAHAASAYYTNDKSNSLVITIDAAGDSVSTTVSIIENGSLKRIHADKWPDSVGQLYSRFTQVLGFSPSRHEGKVLGLSASGNPEPLATEVRKIMSVHDGRMKAKCILGNFSGGTKFVRKLVQGYAKEDIAAAVQCVTEEVTLEFVRYWIEKTNVHDLALAGGVFANVLLNQKLLALPEVHSLFVHPNMGDGGLATGAALYQCNQELQTTPRPLEHVYLARPYDDAEIREALEEAQLPFREEEDLPTAIAHHIAENNVVGLFHGAMEYGPRALGARSILANPSDASINSTLNERLHRTEFMPFAPVVCEEDAADYFKEYELAPYPARFMTITFDVTPELAQKAPAITHVDNTARPQVIRRDHNPLYYDIVKRFKEITGIPVLINTSFNMHEEPIVCTPSDAIRSFRAGAIDVLVLEKYIVEA